MCDTHTHTIALYLSLSRSLVFIREIRLGMLVHFSPPPVNVLRDTHTLSLTLTQCHTEWETECEYHTHTHTRARARETLTLTLHLARAHASLHSVWDSRPQFVARARARELSCSFICVCLPWLFFISTANVRHTSDICVPWLIHVCRDSSMCAMTHSCEITSFHAVSNPPCCECKAWHTRSLSCARERKGEREWEREWERARESTRAQEKERVSCAICDTHILSLAHTHALFFAHARSLSLAHSLSLTLIFSLLFFLALLLSRELARALSFSY